MPKNQIPAVGADELRRAFNVGLLASFGAGDPHPSTCHPNDHPMTLAIAASFPPERAEALALRVFFLRVFIELEAMEPFIGATLSPLGLPELHPAVFDVAANQPLHQKGVDPHSFFKRLREQASAYDALSPQGAFAN